MGPFTRLVGGKKVLMPIPRDIKWNLEFIKELVEQGKLHLLSIGHIDKIGEACDYVASGQKVGNVVILIDAGFTHILGFSRIKSYSRLYLFFSFK